MDNTLTVSNLLLKMASLFMKKNVNPSNAIPYLHNI